MKQVVSEKEIRLTEEVQLVVDVVTDIAKNVNTSNNTEAPKVV